MLGRQKGWSRFWAIAPGTLQPSSPCRCCHAFGLAGAAIDYGRAIGAQSRMSAAIDTAALSANRDASMPLSQRQAITRNIVLSQLAESPWIDVSASDIDVQYDDGVLDVTINAEIKTLVVTMIGFPTMAVTATSQSINRVDDGAEIALVLDTTGSMINDCRPCVPLPLPLRRACSVPVAAIFRVAVVPYVGAANPGPDALIGQTDTGGNSRHHGQQFENWARVSWAKNCELPPSPPWDGGGDDGDDPPPFDPGNGGTEGQGSASIGNFIDRFAAVTGELFGIRAAHAQAVVTPQCLAALRHHDHHEEPAAGAEERHLQQDSGRLHYYSPGNPVNAPCELWGHRRSAISTCSTAFPAQAGKAASRRALNRLT